MPDKLEQYRNNRRFDITGEPSGKGSQSRSAQALPQFVVQKHDASSLHYDLRIEVDEVLKSWAVPRGPSLNPQHKQLAIPTEDHPLEYGAFEGVIPAGEYGAGTVLVWDRGYYEPLAEQAATSADLDRGRIDLWLEGDKIRGGYTLVRMGKRGHEQWLLIKHRDAGADRRRKPVKRQPRSVLSGNDLHDVARPGSRQS